MPPSDTSPNRILAVGIRQIGDLILCGPALRLLRQRFPEARIDFVIDPLAGRVMENHPCIDTLIALPPNGDWLGQLRCIHRLRRERYDWVIDFMSGARSALLTRLTGVALMNSPLMITV